MKNYDKEVHPKGEMLSDNQRVFRVRVLKTFLKAGVPLQKMDDFRELLEDGGYRLTSVPNMRQLIPFVRKEEEEMIKGEISGHNVSVIFDGTTRLGEALAIVVRFITADWEIKQRLVCLQLIAKSLKGEELAPTRWCSWWEVANQITLQFTEIHPFLQARLQEAANKATLRQLDEMLANAQTKLLLQIELAAVVDAGKPMVESTYILEGDGTLAWQCYEQLPLFRTASTVSTSPT